jgi:hypothetical protein
VKRQISLRLAQPWRVLCVLAGRGRFPHGLPTVAALVALIVLIPAGARAQTVTVSVPASVTFNVTNVGVDTAGSPAPTRVTFSGLLALNTLRISIKADAAAFTPPSPSSGIPASNVRWTTSNSSGGTGSNGSVSSAVWTQLFQSALLATSGGVDVTWTLGAPGGGIRAGNHTLTIRYKFEAM